uniref:Uncharacterized protein n=1 Tax=Oryza rufipogon TaxID=4529 RepID=A0A0E0P027_ORYRU
MTAAAKDGVEAGVRPGSHRKEATAGWSTSAHRARRSSAVAAISQGTVHPPPRPRRPVERTKQQSQSKGQSGVPPASDLPNPSSSAEYIASPSAVRRRGRFSSTSSSSSVSLPLLPFLALLLFLAPSDLSLGFLARTDSSSPCCCCCLRFLPDDLATKTQDPFFPPPSVYGISAISSSGFDSSIKQKVYLQGRLH